jgi:hypothetical protein
MHDHPKIGVWLLITLLPRALQSTLSAAFGNVTILLRQSAAGLGPRPMG